MNNERIAQILDRHSIPYMITDGRIYADDMEAFAPANFNQEVTGWTRSELYGWLGY